MGISIRKANVLDASEIARIHVDSWRTTYPGIVPQFYLDSLDVASFAERWKPRLEEAGMHILIAEEDGDLCGFASGGALREPIREPIPDQIQDCDGEIYAIYLLHSSQRRGAGSLLMQHIAEALLASGFRSAALWVLAENPSRGFYERLGGRQIAQKNIRIGDTDLLELAYAWPDIQTLSSAAGSTA